MEPRDALGARKFENRMLRPPKGSMCPCPVDSLAASSGKRLSRKNDKFGSNAAAVSSASFLADRRPKRAARGCLSARRKHAGTSRGPPAWRMRTASEAEQARTGAQVAPQKATPPLVTSVQSEGRLDLVVHRRRRGTARPAATSTKSRRPSPARQTPRKCVERAVPRRSSCPGRRDRSHLVLLIFCKLWRRPRQTNLLGMPPRRHFYELVQREVVQIQQSSSFPELMDRRGRAGGGAGSTV